MINYLTKDTNSDNIWKSEIFGRSLDVIVQEGIQAKLSMMPDNIRYKLGNTLIKIINNGSMMLLLYNKYHRTVFFFKQKLTNPDKIS